MQPASGLQLVIAHCKVEAGVRIHTLVDVSVPKIWKELLSEDGREPKGVTNPVQRSQRECATAAMSNWMLAQTDAASSPSYPAKAPGAVLQSCTQCPKVSYQPTRPFCNLMS